MRLRDGHFTNLSLWSQDQARVWKSDYHSSETVKRGEGTREKDLKTCRERLKEKHTLRGTFESMYSVILHYSKCYCVLLLTDVCCFLFFFFSSLSQHDSVCNYYVVQLQTSVLFVFSQTFESTYITYNYKQMLLLRFIASMGLLSCCQIFIFLSKNCGLTPQLPNYAPLVCLLLTWLAVCKETKRIKYHVTSWK